MPTPTLSLALIVKDEERCLARCLSSTAGLFDETVVLDTGSTDRTVAIADEHGATVHTFAWVDDFAAARNAAIAHTSGDWVLMLDADEWLLPGADAVLADVRRQAPTFVGEIDVASTIGLRTAGDPGLDGRKPGTRREESPDSAVDGGTTASGWIPRLLPRGVRWTGRIHEQPDWSGPILRTGIRAGHDGYTPELIAAKRGRNAALLRTELQEQPDDAYLLLQLGRALESDREYADAADTYLRALSLTDPAVPARHDLVVRLLFTLGQADRTQEALDVADAEGTRWSESPDFHFCLGDLLLTHGIAHPEDTTQVLPMIEGAWLRALEIGDRPDLVGAVAGRGGHLAAYNLAVLYESMGQPGRASEFHQRSRDLRPLR
ncbi:glycosyltransferase [Nocardioides sp. Kera G14]|uniref:glycosyltransferase n=1 Tax=Nocardioides sp. Kera G14 TaxID=2884264 RepID=UPI001D1144C8|nr:glycosyltransferase [Nocardioides sp. Kera G14]UDY24074.1 glycosyltransferase [Nocardioides sp. Kera G14]